MKEEEIKKFVLWEYDANNTSTIKELEFSVALLKAIQRKANLYLEYREGKYILWECT